MKKLNLTENFWKEYSNQHFGVLQCEVCKSYIDKPKYWIEQFYINGNLGKITYFCNAEHSTKYYEGNKNGKI